jgi:hypothetical protein
VGKGSQKAATRREETSDEGTSRREGKTSTGSGAEGADARVGRGPRGWCPWWPDGHKEEGSPDHLQGPETTTKASARVGAG